MPKMLTLSDEVMREVEYAAAAQHTTVDDFVLSALKKALPLRIVPNAVTGMPTFELSPNAQAFNSDDVRRADDDA